MEYGREMYALQSADENRRMEQQNQWNKEAAAQSQEYAKEMFDYTGYENQVKQMKAAGLNPALLNGGAGSAGQAHGATVNPATAMQPMGLEVALQAQQTAAQTALTNAQAEKVRSETTAQKVENMVGIGIDLAKKVAEVRKNKKDTEEVEQKIENLKKTAEATEESIKLIQANTANKEVQTRIAQFQDDMNKVIQSSSWFEKGKSHEWEETVTFYHAGSYFPFRSDYIKSKKSKQVHVYIGSVRGQNKVTNLFVANLMYQSDKVAKIADVPNRFGNGDTVIIDCEKKT